MADATVLIVPGLRDHAPGHWQTLLAARTPHAVSVSPMGRDNVDLDTRLDAIEAAANAVEGPLIVVAHSAGCIMVAHWAGRTKRPVDGALLAVPPDLESPMPAGYPTIGALEAAGWFPVPREPLRFPSIVAASVDDPLGRFERVSALSHAWGSRLVNLGAVGHLNPASGYGDWPRADEFITELAGAARPRAKMARR
jgi:predicted alpha/beta hydrolase family esterase